MKPTPRPVEVDARSVEYLVRRVWPVPAVGVSGAEVEALRRAMARAALAAQRNGGAAAIFLRAACAGAEPPRELRPPEAWDDTLEAIRARVDRMPDEALIVVDDAESGAAVVFREGQDVDDPEEKPCARTYNDDFAAFFASAPSDVRVLVRDLTASMTREHEARMALLAMTEELLAERESRRRLEEREASFAAALGVADGGRYANDWPGAIQRVARDRDVAVALLVEAGYDPGLVDRDITDAAQRAEAFMRAARAVADTVESFYRRLDVAPGGSVAAALTVLRAGSLPDLLPGNATLHEELAATRKRAERAEGIARTLVNEVQGFVETWAPVVGEASEEGDDGKAR